MLAVGAEATPGDGRAELGGAELGGAELGGAADEGVEGLPPAAGADRPSVLVGSGPLRFALDGTFPDEPSSADSK